MVYRMKYGQPAENSDRGWESQSLPVGNGYLGANVFGGVETERVQVTEEGFFNPAHLGGFNSLADIYFDFPHQDYTDYERGLLLDDALAYCRYASGSVGYRREVFASYPDRVLVMRFEADRPGSLDMGVRLTIPYLKDYAAEPGDGGGKTGRVVWQGNTALMRGKMNAYELTFESRLTVIHEGGTAVAEADRMAVAGADCITVLFIPLTDYTLESRVFLEEEDKKKVRPAEIGAKLDKLMENAAAFGYAELKNRHLKDYRHLFSRVRLNLGEVNNEACTDILLKEYAEGRRSAYLEAVYFQYGRYLLIASSRPGTLPANLQGVWNCHDQSPWGSGFWHNINVQMNYWPAFNTNLAETFAAYISFNEAFRKTAEKIASAYIQENVPENFVAGDGVCGWTIGTGAYPYAISAPGGHSGPGTAGLTGKLFWDYYDFTRSKAILEKTVYPALFGVAQFLTKAVREYEGVYLADPSASPEQLINRQFLREASYYQTIGCAFDQQMIWENGRDFLAAAELAGFQDKLTDTQGDDFTYRLGCPTLHAKLIETQRRQQDHYAPVQIGLSGQIKEYSEEGLYGEIGEYHHRHISQLVGLYPGTLISSHTPAWLDAARLTLLYRGDESTGWALAHRLNAWARIRDGEHAYTLLNDLLGQRTMENLWDLHPPFQIDGNFGGTAGMAEMLLQSHEGSIAVLPALPAAWKDGSFSGLMARGSFQVAAEWRDGMAADIEILSRCGGVCTVEYGMIAGAALYCEERAVSFTVISNDKISFATESGKTYRFTDLKTAPVTAMPQGFGLNQEGSLVWETGANILYNLYAAIGDDRDYTLLAKELTASGYFDRSGLFERNERVTYKLTAIAKGKRESRGALFVRNHKSELEMARYRRNLAVDKKAGMKAVKKGQ